MRKKKSQSRRTKPPRRPPIAKGTDSLPNPHDPNRDEHEIALAISKLRGIPYASKSNQILKMETGQQLENLVTKEYARKHVIFPLFLDNGVLAIAMADPDSSPRLQELGESTGCKIEPFVGTKSEILAAIDEQYPS